MKEGQNKEIAVGVSGRSCDLGKIHPLHIELSLIVYTPLEFKLCQTLSTDNQYLSSSTITLFFEIKFSKILS